MRTTLAFLIAVAGCGDNIGSLPDALSPGDTAVPDASGPVVRLTITDANVPAVGATVYFQNPDSSLVAKVTTDVDGVAVATMPDGGYVTAIEPRVAASFGVIVLRDRLSTFAGVKPGDDLHLDLRPLRLETPVSVTVTVPEDTDAEVAEYRLHTPCGGALLTISPPTEPSRVSLSGCGAVTDMFVVTSDISTRPLRAIYHQDQALSDGAAIAIPGPYSDVAPLPVDVTSTPAWVSHYGVEIDVMSSRGRLFPVFAVIDPVVALSAVLDIPAIAGTTALLRADVYPTQPALEHQILLSWGLPFSAQTLDMSARALRQLTSMPMFDPQTRTLAWTDAAGVTPDVVRAEVYTYRDGDPATAWHWQLVAPHAGTSLTYPVLQGDAATAFTTTSADSFGVSGFETLAIAGGYDRIRSHGLRRALDAALPGAPGQLSYQRLDEPNLLVPFTRGTR